MKRTLHIIISMAVLAAVFGCTGGGGDGRGSRTPNPNDSLNAETKVMNVYDYQPELALRILDSVVAAGSLSQTRGDFCRMRIYCWSQMGSQIDSLLHGPDGVRFDSARAIGERLLQRDSARLDLGLRQHVLEQLVYTARQQADTAHWLNWSQQLVEVCHARGPETETAALRTEAEVGAVLCAMGRRQEGMSRIDSVIAILDSHENRHFNELDATIIALKRKIVVLSTEGSPAETIPLSSRIIERLDDYEKHPQEYHDGSYREPKDSVCRADYINFYRSQAQGFITAAYASLAEYGNMNETYAAIERSVREVTAREHIARYRALEQRLEAEQQKNRAERNAYLAIMLSISLLLALLFALYSNKQKRKMAEKNRALARMIDEIQAAGENADNKAVAKSPLIENPVLADLFASIDALVRSERLYADQTLQRQDVAERFNIRRETLNQLFNDYAGGLSFPAYINSIRLGEACRLLREQPDRTVASVAEEVGLTLRNLQKLFRDQYGITPTEYRRNRT